MELKVIAAEHIVATGNKDGRWTDKYLVPEEEVTKAIEALTKERDEADRRAGAAERWMDGVKEERLARERWLSKAKEQWGVHRNTSFDVVWNEALQLKASSDAERQKVEALQRERDEAKQVTENVYRMAREDTAAMQAALNAERQRTRTATQLIVETIGATGPEDLESALGRLVAQLDAERAAQKSLCDIIAELRTSLDAERERVRQNLLTIMDLQTQLTQLQALVRVYKEAVDYYAKTAIGARAVTALEKAATLDATTPATRQRQVHSCEIPGCVSCANPEEGGDGE